MKFFLLGATSEIAGLAQIGFAALQTLKAFDKVAEASDAAARDLAQNAALPWLVAMIIGACLFAAGILVLVFAIRWQMQASGTPGDDARSAEATHADAACAAGEPERINGNSA